MIHLQVKEGFLFCFYLESCVDPPFNFYPHIKGYFNWILDHFIDAQTKINTVLNATRTSAQTRAQQASEHLPGGFLNICAY